MTSHLSLLTQIADELRIVSRDNYYHSAFGLVPMESREPYVVDGPPKDQVAGMVAQIGYFIYVHYHLDWAVEVARLQRGDPPDLTPVVLREDQDFAGRLREANRSRGYSSPGWKVTRVGDCCVEVVRDGLSLTAQSSELVPTCGTAKPGDLVSLRFPKDMPYASPGFYTAVGDEGFVDSRLCSLVRLYFNVLPSAGGSLLSSLTTLLNGLRVRFLLKILNNPDAYSRPDASVLYIQREDFCRIREAFAEIHPFLSQSFCKSTPAFAKRLAPGIAVAEEPQVPIPRRVSFGQHRSSLVARGIVNAYLDGRHTCRERYERVLQAFYEEGLDPSVPYINAASTDVYPELVE